MEGTKLSWEQYPVPVKIFKYLKMQAESGGHFQKISNRKKYTKMAAEAATAPEEQQSAGCESLFQHPGLR